MIFATFTSVVLIFLAYFPDYQNENYYSHSEEKLVSQDYPWIQSFVENLERQKQLDKKEPLYLIIGTDVHQDPEQMVTSLQLALSKAGYKLYENSCIFRGEESPDLLCLKLQSCYGTDEIKKAHIMALSVTGPEPYSLNQFKSCERSTKLYGENE